MKACPKFWLAVKVLPLTALTLIALLAQPAHADGLWGLVNRPTFALIAHGGVVHPNSMLTSSSSTIYVDASNQSGIEDGTQGHPFNTIQEGLGVARSGDIVQVAAGTYHEKITLKSGVQLFGAGAQVTIIDGTGQNDAVVSASNAISETLVDGFTITNGTGKWKGGYTYGGGLYVSNSTVALRNCIVTNNSASDGAGGLQTADSTIAVENCTFSNNRGWWGGAITISGGVGKIQSSAIAGSSSGYGGAIFVGDSQTAIVNSIVMHNSSPSAIGVGGGATVAITNSTIVDNTGSGIEANSYYVGSGGVATIVNSILWGNNDDLVNLTATYSDIEDGDPGEGNISTYPLFVDLAGNDYHLRPLSQCIDAGTNEGAPSTDFDGDPRPIDGDRNGSAVVDMGADEFVPAADLWVAKTASPDPVGVGNALTYTIMITNIGVLPATGIIFTDTLPTGCMFHAASAGCAEASNVVTCTLDSLLNAASATLTIGVTPTLPGTLTNIVTATTLTTETNKVNNTASRTVTVKSFTTTSVASSKNPSTFGQTVTLTATIAAGGGTPTGNVTFKDGLTTLGSSALSGGIATFSTAALAAGTHTLTAEYSGDDNCMSSVSDGLAQQVNQAATTTLVVSSKNPSAFGERVTLTATVAASGATPTGNVTFKDSATTLGASALSGGVATFSTAALAAGMHTITAEYNGDSNCMGSVSDGLIQTVPPPVYLPFVAVRNR